MSTTNRGQNQSTDSTQATITGPHPEPNAYGGYTGHHYLRCEDCGAEWLTDDTEWHQPGCSQR